MVAAAYRALVEYDGTEFGGFQVQPDRRTIQGELERSLQSITQAFVRVHGAGRTDAGVHARGQVISLRTAWSRGPDALQRALNAVLPRDIAVRDLSVADEKFHARFSATSRLYVYTVYTGPVRAPLLDRHAYHVSGAVDLGAMQCASRCLKGEHDFACFGQAPSGENTVRVVHRAEWRSEAAVSEGICDRGSTRLLRFEVQANGFLRGMVRRVVGTFLAVGRGVLTVGEFHQILASRDIGQARVPAPARGLCLLRVCYDDEGRGARCTGGSPRYGGAPHL